MPTYEYECGKCQFRFERKQSFDEEPVAACPQCQGKARRVIHSTPVIFKGSGFYSTDNRKHGKSEEHKEPAKGKEEVSGKEKGK
ncbi:MAG: zinc ribbon domain-containing protein [Chloroflexi bacterium]|nr:zinc ribbon domain-containing protein [Chloroflexota bacterium]